MITAHKEIYNLFGSGIYHKPHSIFKSKYYELYIGKKISFSCTDNRMAGSFIGMHRDMRMKKSLPATVSSVELNSMVLNSKLSKVVLYIQDNEAWYRIYVLFKYFSPCLWVISLSDTNKAGLDKVYY